MTQLFGASVSITGCRTLKGQAGNRIYHRLHLEGGGPSTMLLVELPADPFASEEAAQSGISRELPFCNVLRFLHRLEIPVPILYHDASSRGFLLLQDLGDATMFSAVSCANQDVKRQYYTQAIDLLIRFQEKTVTLLKRGETDGCIGYSRSFGYDLLRWELEHFEEWLLRDYYGAVLSPQQELVVHAAFDSIASTLEQSGRVLVHRDFQSTNLMLTESGMHLIDFQDCLMGPAPYDLVALLRDSYVQLSPALLEELVGYYLERGGENLPDDARADFSRLFHLQVLQRKLKDAGRFVFIDRKKGNPSFLPFIEPTLSYISSSLSQLPQYGDLQRVLKAHIPPIASSSGQA